MKLITKQIISQFKKIGPQDMEIDPIVVAKFFNPTGSATWFATSFEESTNICTGYVKGLMPGCDEFGSFSITELESVRCPPFGLPIERDIHFEPQPISKVVPELAPRIELRKQRKLAKEKANNKDLEL